jgi:hypothetical protein
MQSDASDVVFLVGLKRDRQALAEGVRVARFRR